MASLCLVDGLHADLGAPNALRPGRALLLLTGSLALWLLRGFGGTRIQRAAIDWMRSHHDRELAFDGPMRL